MYKITIFNLLPALLFLLSCGKTTQKNNLNIERKEQVIRIDTQKAKNQKITIYNEKGDFFLAVDFVQEQIIFSEDTVSIGDYEAEKTRLTEKYNFFPLIFFPEYELMDFVALGKNQTSNRYLIKLGNDNVGYIETSEGVNALIWEDYLRNKGVVINQETGIFEKITDKKPTSVLSKTIDYSFKIINVEGDWIKVKCDNTCLECPKNAAKGWIKWRAGEKILIQIGYIC